MARDKANDLALLRNTQGALENGFIYFTIVDANEYAQTGSYPSPNRTTTNVNASTYGTVNMTGNITVNNAIYNDNINETKTTPSSLILTNYYLSLSEALYTRMNNVI